MVAKVTIRTVYRIYTTDWINAGEELFVRSWKEPTTTEETTIGPTYSFHKLQDGHDCLLLGLDGHDEGCYNCCWGLERLQWDASVTADLMTLALAAEVISARSDSMASNISGLIEGNVRILNSVPWCYLTNWARSG